MQRKTIAIRIVAFIIVIFASVIFPFQKAQASCIYGESRKDRSAPWDDTCVVKSGHCTVTTSTGNAKSSIEDALSGGWAYYNCGTDTAGDYCYKHDWCCTSACSSGGGSSGGGSSTYTYCSEDVRPIITSVTGESNIVIRWKLTNENHNDPKNFQVWIGDDSCPTGHCVYYKTKISSTARKWVSV